MIKKDKWFCFASGRKASSIEELKELLKNMGETEFRHHVNNERNDFANWIEDVFGETRLAQSMREVSEREGLLIILENFLKKKQHKPEHSTRISSEVGKELSEKDIKNMVDEAKQVFEKEIEEEEKYKVERTEPPRPEHLKLKYPKPEHHRFVVKEFIYGFILGLIFGLLMLGIIFNLKF
nr:hypothetical protein [Nanoarchaeota archaeon]